MAHANSLNPNPFRILFEDQHLLVLSKEPNLLSQGDHTGDASLVDLLRVYFNRNYVGLVHRLDRNTSGLMVIAKRSKSAERLTQQLQDGDLKRAYHAVLWGEMKSNEPVRLEDWLLKNESTNEVRVVKSGTSGAKLAVLRLLPIQSLLVSSQNTAVTLARFELETGRSHQIRAALFSRPALHSCALEFLHPISKEKMNFNEALSPDLIAAFPGLKP
jgi:23S rRNA pseudouridine1911/1915/1917 synthase